MKYYLVAWLYTNENNVTLHENAVLAGISPNEWAYEVTFNNGPLPGTLTLATEITQEEYEKWPAEWRRTREEDLG